MWVTERIEQVLDSIVCCHPIRSHSDEAAMHDYTVIKVARSGSEHALFFRKVHDADKAQLAEAREHLIGVMQDRMGTSTR